MHPTSRPRTVRARTLVLVLLSLTLVAGAVALGPVRDGGRLPEAGAQAARAVTLSRSSALAGETVTVRWSGYNPGAPVSIFQCRLDPLESWTSSCAEPTWTAGVTGPDGTGSAEFLVWQFTFQGLGANPGLFCGETGCGIVVTECDTELSPGLFASAPLGVPFGGTNPVDGGDDDLEPAGLVAQVAAAPAAASAVQIGQSAQTPQAAAAASRTLNVQAGQAMDPVLPRLAEAVEAKDINLDSTVLNSPSSVEAFVNGRTDLALSGRPLSDAQFAELEASGRPAVMVPVALSPLGVIHNMDVRGVPIQRFRLSVDSAAKLYRGLIVGVDSVDLRRDNGGCGITMSGRTTDRSIRGIFRTGRSSANYTFSKWLDSAGVDEAGVRLWPPIQAEGQPAESPSEQFPSASSDKSKVDNRELAEYVQVGTLPGASGEPITNDQGRLRLGFVDMSSVKELVETSPPPTKPGLFPIRLAQISNASGNWVTPSPESVSATIAESAIDEDHVVDVNVRATAPNAYPLVSVIYAVVPKQPSGSYDATKARTGKDFVDYLLSDEGQELMSEAGFVALSGELEQESAKAAAEISIDVVAAPPPASAPPATTDEFVLGGSEFADAGFGSDGFGSDGFESTDGGFGEDPGGFTDDGGVATDSSGSGDEEALGESTIETSASLLERAAGAPTLIALLVLGGLALVAGQGLKRADRRRRRQAEGTA